jgi:hypothetical protein
MLCFFYFYYLLYLPYFPTLYTLLLLYFPILLLPILLPMLTLPIIHLFIIVSRGRAPYRRCIGSYAREISCPMARAPMLLGADYVRPMAIPML